MKPYFGTVLLLLTAGVAAMFGAWMAGLLFAGAALLAAVDAWDEERAGDSRRRNK